MADNSSTHIGALGDNYLEAVFDNYFDGIYITDGEANTIYLNHAYELITGLTYTDMVGQNMAALVSEGVISHSGSLDVLNSGKAVSMEQQFRTGKRALITSMPVTKDVDGNCRIVMILTVVREITQLYLLRKELQALRQQNLQYANELKKLTHLLEGNTEILTEDAATAQMMRIAEKFAVLENAVFLRGPKGSGKEYIARFIHSHSVRAERMFMRLSLSLIPKEDPIRYLFGYTDAESGQYNMGVLENMDGGTVYIDELADLCEGEVRSRLLSLLQNKACLLGDHVYHRLDIRFISGSTHTLEELRDIYGIETELLKSLTVLPLRIPPLSERKDDIIPLANAFLRRYTGASGEPKRFSRESLLKLHSYDWPENISELEKTVQRAAILSNGEEITEDDVLLPQAAASDTGRPYTPKYTPETLPEFFDLKRELEQIEAEYLRISYEKNGNVRAAAKNLGMDGSTYVRKRKRYNDLLPADDT